MEDLKQKLIAERKKNLTLQLQCNSIKKSLIIAVSHPAEPGGGPEAEAHCGAEEESDPAIQYNNIKKSLIIAVSHPAESGGGSEAEAHCGAEEESDPGGKRPRGTLPGTYKDFSFIIAESYPD